MDDIASFGSLLKFWRRNRRLSQLGLADEAELSARHLSFLENGRSNPSRDMLLRLIGALSLPLREADTLLLAAGFAPAHRGHAKADPYQAIEAPLAMLLEGHHPYPAIAIDRYWNIRRANRAVPPLLAGLAPELLAPPINAIRLSLHPGGLLPRILNAYQWREHLLQRLRQQFRLSADPALGALIDEAVAYPAPPRPNGSRASNNGPIMPILGWIALIVFTVQKGTEGENRFGPPA